MENNSLDKIPDKVVEGIAKKFLLLGSHRVHPWYAWAIVGIVFGMALGIVYVANRSAQFVASRAQTEISQVALGENSGLRFLFPENNSVIETNPVLIVESLENNGEPSYKPLKFWLARTGSEEFTELLVNYNLGQFNPGVYRAIPMVFSPNEDGEVMESGAYTIRVTRSKDEEEDEDLLTAQAYNKPLLPTPPAWSKQPYADFNFQFFSKPTRKGLPAAVTCGCEKIEIIKSGKSDPKFDKLNDFWGLPYQLGPLAGFRKNATAYFLYAFEIKAKTTPGSFPGRCQEGQLIKATGTLNVGEKNERTQDVTAVPGMNPYTATALGLHFTDATIRNEFLSKYYKEGITTFPFNGTRYTSDGYSNGADNKYYDFGTGGSPPFAKWHDSPGYLTTNRSDYPAKFEADFVHFVNGEDPGGVILYGQKAIADYLAKYGLQPDDIVTSVQLPPIWTGNRWINVSGIKITHKAGKSCECKSRVEIYIDKKGADPKFRMTTDCDSATGGKAGTTNAGAGSGSGAGQGGLTPR